MEQSAFDEARATAQDCAYSQFGVGASYVPSGGSAVDINVLVLERTTGTQDKPASRSRSIRLRGSVRVSEVETLGRGDTIQLSDDSVVFKIVPSSVTNDGLEWEFEATAEVTTTLGNVRILPDH